MLECFYYKTMKKQEQSKSDIFSLFHIFACMPFHLEMTNISVSRQDLQSDYLDACD